VREAVHPGQHRLSGPPKRVPIQPDFPKLLLTRERVKDILRRLYKELFYPVPTGAKRSGQFYRGMPEYMAVLAGKTAVGNADELVVQVSPLGRFHLRLTTDRLTEWLGHPVMRLVDRLDVVPPKTRGNATLNGADLRALAGSGLPKRLTQLMIRASMDPEAEAIYRSEVARGPLVSYCPSIFPAQ
jgi:hypothetical protein